MDDTKPACMRMYAWWVLLQSWCTLRFSDHRGISPRTVQEGAGFWSMFLERSKTIGRDKNVQMRPLYLDAACFFQHPDLVRVWVETPQSACASGPRLLSTGSNARTARLHKGGDALRRGVCHLRQTSCATLRLHAAAPHPGILPSTSGSRTRPELSCPSSSSAMGFPKSDRDYLGGWAAENSDRYSRVARLKIQTM